MAKKKATETPAFPPASARDTDFPSDLESAQSDTPVHSASFLSFPHIPERFEPGDFENILRLVYNWAHKVETVTGILIDPPKDTE